jgi:ElaB/YqjD/DUF883 family membrane-anchored ribosome-binding protein
MSNDYEKAVDTLMKDVKDLRADIKGILSALHGKARDRVDGAKESLHESVAEGMEQVRDAVDAIERRCRGGLKSCAAKIEERPFFSLLAALGVGVVLGCLLRRGRR